ncbi:MAG: hypothetical protein NDI63_08285 [Pseudobdellovibrio sp.]|nr:hypothetical protein [Pseudobdellovibrio sp.]
MPISFNFFVLSIIILLQSALGQAAPAQHSEAVDPEKYRWLYEQLIPAQDRASQPDRAFKSFRVHLLDSLQYFPQPSYLSVTHFNRKTEIAGNITYIGFIPKKYNYDVIFNSANDVTLKVKVFFIDPEGQDNENFKAKFAQAEKIWNTNLLPLDFKYKFQFQVVNNPFVAHYSVLLQDDTRGPYDTQWNRNWSATSVAHELGHMLGLGDEYETISSESDCLPKSLMCESFKGLPTRSHYYFILRRLMK